MNLVSNNGIVNDLIELALQLPDDADAIPPGQYGNRVRRFLVEVGAVAREIMHAVEKRHDAFAVGCATTPSGAHGAKGDK